MREIVVATNNFTKRDMLNCKAGNPLQNFDGSITMNNIARCAILKDTDAETGEIKDVGVLVTDDKQYFTTISATVIDSLEELIEIIDEEGNVNVRIDKRQSNNHREFLTMTIL